MNHAADPRRLRRVFVEVTNTCNLNCSFCTGTTRPPTRMSPEFLDDVLGQVGQVSDQICLHVLGEPLTHPNFPTLLEISSRRRLAVNVTTNGTRINTPAGRALLGSMVRQVNISLQALIDDEKINHRALEDIVHFLHQALALRPDLYVNLRLWNFGSAGTAPPTENAKILEQVAKGLGVPILPPPAGRKSRVITGRIYLHQDSLFAWPDAHAPFVGTTGRCQALLDHCAILADGTVCPCCLDANGIMALGNVRDTALIDILENSRARAMREGFRHGILTETLCQSCGYCRRFPVPGNHDAAPRDCKTPAR